MSQIQFNDYERLLQVKFTEGIKQTARLKRDCPRRL